MLRRPVLSLLLCGTLWVVCLALPGPVAWAQSWWDTVLRVTGIAATPSQQRGIDNGSTAGDIWVITLAQHTRQRLTFDSGYGSPLFLPGDANLLALKGEAIVQIPRAGGAPVQRHTVPGVHKLVGVHRDNGDQVLILLRPPSGPRPTVGLLSLRSGRVTPLPTGQSPDDQRRYNHLRGWDRVYGDTTLSVQEQPTQGPGGVAVWTDVYRKHGNNPAENLSRCADSHSTCGQPSLSHDGTVVAYVKAWR